MRNKIVAIQGNKLSKLNPTTDTSIFLAKEAQKIGLKLFYYEPQYLSIVNNKVIAKGNFVKFTNNKKFYKILDNKLLDLSTVKYILIRQDPPFNLEYITTTYILDNLNKVKIINNPSAIRNISEKLYSTKFMKYLPRTIFSSNIKQIKKFLKLNKKIIIKPIHGYSGNNIKLLKGKLNKKEIVNYLNKHGHIMCQKFLPLIKFGDKRVFIINGKVVGAISRVPKKGSFLSNLSKGASAKLIKLTKKELSISKIVAKDLKQNNIYFAGIDFISGKLNGDINVTSPTGLKTFFDLSGINLAKIFWNNLK
jgi:glutathione synthase|tara:strand:- start:771 stop:1691 length:921 start_codon:yes stop_codon:yes gene_type:complete